MRHRPRLPAAPTTPLAKTRYRHGKGRPYTADVVDRVRVLVEGSTWPEAAIARQVGIGVATETGRVHPAGP